MNAKIFNSKNFKRLDITKKCMIYCNNSIWGKTCK